MAEYIEREKLGADFELCNKQNPRWTPQRVASLIARENAADVVEVKHGRWLEFEPFMSCSECDTDWYYVDNDCDRFDYCPNCGADMRVGKAEKLESHSKEDGE